MPAVGSSSNTSVGSCTNAAAKARRRCMPPDASRTFLSRCSYELDPLQQPTQAVTAPQAQPVHRRVEAEVLPQREVREHRRDLRQVADLLPLRRREASRRRPPHRRRPGRRLEQADQQPNGGRLAAPARPDQPDDLPRGDCQLQPAHDLLVSKRLAQPCAGQDEFVHCHDRRILPMFDALGPSGRVPAGRTRGRTPSNERRRQGVTARHDCAPGCAVTGRRSCRRVRTARRRRRSRARGGRWDGA